MLYSGGLLLKKMKILVFILIFIFGMLAGNGFSQGKEVSDSKVLGKLKKFRADFARSMVERKPEVVQNYFAENIKLMPEFERTIMGKSNALNYYRVFTSYFEVKAYNRIENNILDMDSLIFEMGTFSMDITVKSSGEQIDVKGKYINVWRKTKESGLLLLTDAWNYNARPALEEKLKFVQKSRNENELWKSKSGLHNSFEKTAVLIIPNYVPLNHFSI